MSLTEQAVSAENAFFSATLAEADPEIADAIGKELGRQQRRDRADRLREHRLARRARGAGLGADQQVRRGLSGQALLRRLRVRRHRRDARDRAREEAVRLRLRQRPAELRQPDEPGGVPGAAPARRHLHGPRPRRRRPPHPRLAGQHVGQVVQGRALRRAPRRPAHRHDEVAADRRGDEAEADHRRRHGLFAASGTSSASARSPTRSAPISWSTWRISPASSPAARIPRRSRMPMSSPRPRTRRCAARAAA